MYEEISREVFRQGILMERVYQMFRTCLHMSRKDGRFTELKQKIMDIYRNENLEKMKAIFISCNRVIEDGRFAVVNVSPTRGARI